MESLRTCFFLIISFTAGIFHLSAQNADFSANDTSLCINGSIVFTAGFSGAGSYEWNFGDGAVPSVASLEGPHTVSYSTPGLKTVTLRVNDSIENILLNYIEVFALSNGGSISGNNVAICPGESTGNMVLSGFTGNILYWQKQLDGGSWENITNTTNSHTENISVAGTWKYRAIVRNGECVEAFSGEATIIVHPEPLGSNVTKTAVCSGTGFNYTLQDEILNSVESTITWTAVYPIGLTGGTASGATTISGNLTNLLGSVLQAVYTITPVSTQGCAGSSFTLTLPVNPIPTAIASPSSQSVCSGNPFQLIELITTNGVSGTSYSWVRDRVGVITGIPASGTGNISGIFQNNTGAPVQVNFTITPYGAGGCAGAVFFASVIVNPKPEVSFFIKSTFNILEDPYTLTGNPSGGTFNGPGVVGHENKFYPSIAGLGGPFMITYTYTDGNGCVNSASHPVHVQKADREILGFSATGVHCYEEGNIALWVEGSGAPGDFFGNGISDHGNNTANFNTISAGSGTHLISYKYTDGGSDYSIERMVVVDSVGQVDFMTLLPGYCLDHGFVNLSGISPAGGTGNFFGPANGFVSLGKTAQLQTTLAGVGNYSIRYEYTSPLGCKAEISKPVTIHPHPVLDLNIRATFNIMEEPVNMVPFASPVGGQFSGRGISSSESVFSPSLAGLGTAGITYSFRDMNGCASSAYQEVTVLQAEASIQGFPGNNVVCYDAGIVPIRASSSNGLTGGIIAGTGITQTFPDSALFDPTTAGAGSHIISYTYEDIHSTSFSVNRTILVDSVGNVDFVGLLDGYCISAGEVTLSAIAPAGGNSLFTGPPEGLFSLGRNAFFRPNNLTPGEHTIGFIYTSSNGCSGQHTKSVDVFPLPEVSINLRQTFNIDEAPVSLIGDGLPLGGIFSGTGVSASDNLFSPGLAGVGAFPIQYQYTDNNSCSNTDTQLVTVVSTQAFIQGFNESGTVCYDAGMIELTGGSFNGLPGGYFQGEGILNTEPDKATFNPVNAGAGSHIVSYHYSDYAGTWFEFNRSVFVDSIGVVSIVNLPDGTEFCKNDVPFELLATPLGGLFTASSGLSGNSIVPENANIGLNEIHYRITSQFGCSKQVTRTIDIHEIPMVDLTIVNPCIDLSNPDSISFVNLTTTQNDPVALWEWNFGNNLATEEENNSGLFAPRHVYRSSGLRNVRLTATTDKGCSVSLVKQIDIGDMPRANFLWNNECFVENQPISFLDASQSNTPMASYHWNFYDASGQGVMHTANGLNTEYLFEELNYYDVELILVTQLNCSDTIRKTVYLRPTIHLSEGDYTEDFNEGAYGWVPHNSTGFSANSWTFGPTDETPFHSENSNVNAWFTAISDRKAIEQSWVMSPCFDFRDTKRPLIALDLWRHFERNRDGGNIQYSTDNGIQWNSIGTLGDGVNWFNSFQIAGSPGGQQLGWTAPANGLPDNSWKDTKHDLDFLVGEPNVRFRLAYGSDGTALNNQGYAFGNIKISERTRLVLLEHFTNSSSEANASANTIIENVVKNRPNSISFINYHVSFPGMDTLNRLNPADPAARALFYGISKSPFSVMDGSLNGKGRYDYFLSDFNDFDLNLRTFLDPGFKINLDQSMLDGNLNIKVDIQALIPFSNSELTLHLVVVEEEIEASRVGIGGDLIFRNVVRKLLPDASGTRISQNWNSMDSASYSFTWNMQHAYDIEKIGVVAFIQDEATKEIYQTASNLSYTPPIGIGPGNLADKPGRITVYPNPARDHVFIQFDKPLSRPATLRMYNITGRLMIEEVLFEGNSLFYFDTVMLDKGVYIYSIGTGNEARQSGRIVVVK